MADVSAEMIGPFVDTYKVTSGGIRVPYLSAHPLNAQQTDWTLVLDERMALDVRAEDLTQVVAFVADAMAVAAGYKSHAHACEHKGERHNPFGTQVIGLSGGELEAMKATE